jgi:hypothetical protein
MQRDTLSAVILGAAGDPVPDPREAPFLSPLPSRERARVRGSYFPFVVSLSNHERMPPARSMAARGQSLLALPKSNQKASPCTPLLPPVLATGGRRTNRPMARYPRAVGSWCDATTARCSAPRRGLKGRLERRQLFSESLIACGLRPINRHLSIYGIFGHGALIQWDFQRKAACSPDARHPGSGGIHSTEIKFDFAKLRNPDASIRATGQ